MRTIFLLYVKSLCIILVLLNVCFNVEKSIIFKDSYILSNLNIAFIIFFTLITSFKYNILKENIENENKNKFLKCTIIVIISFIIINAIYIIVPKCYEINDFLIIDDELHKLRLMDFIFLPKYYEDINILKMTCLETIFSLILVYIAYLRETKTQGNIKYIL